MARSVCSSGSKLRAWSCLRSKSELCKSENVAEVMHEGNFQFSESSRNTLPFVSTHIRPEYIGSFYQRSISYQTNDEFFGIIS